MTYPSRPHPTPQHNRKQAMKRLQVNRQTLGVLPRRDDYAGTTPLAVGVDDRAAGSEADGQDAVGEEEVTEGGVFEEGGGCGRFGENPAEDWVGREGGGEGFGGGMAAGWEERMLGR